MLIGPAEDDYHRGFARGLNIGLLVAAAVGILVWATMAIG